MSQPCAITTCKRASRTLCDCCRQNLCIQHLSEHNTLLISELDPLVDEINLINDRLQTINFEKISEKYLEKLQAWRLDCHQKIDYLFERKCQELDQRLAEKVVKQRNEISQIQSKAMELIHEQETTRKDVDLLTSTIRHLQRKMNNSIENCFEMNISPLIIDGTLIDIKESDEYKLDLFTFTPIYKTINYSSKSWYSLASNDRFLLIHQKPNLCLLDRQLSIVKQTKWSHDAIWNICWSETLNRFIIVEENNIFLVDENTMSIENVKNIKGQKWLSCTCSDRYLFLSRRQWGSSIGKFSLLPSIECLDDWKPPTKCANDECIDNISYKNDTLILIITNRIEKSVRMELRSSTTLDQLWFLRLDIQCNQNKTFCACSINDNDWLMADYETQRLLYITKDGHIKTTIEYNQIPYRICRFGPNILAISTEIGVNLHKM